MAGSRPTAVQVADRALVLYALVRRGSIELVIAETDGDPVRSIRAKRRVPRPTRGSNARGCAPP